LPGTVFVNCDLPSVVHRCEDPEWLFGQVPDNSVVVLDEVHRLADPSRVLKVAPGVGEPYEFRLGELVVRAVGCADLLAAYR